jgi:hypothetical protein
MNRLSDNFEQRQAIGLNRCRDAIKGYQDGERRSGRAYHVLQALVIGFSGLTPILILWSDIPKAIQALPSALAAILAGLLATFRFQETYVRLGYAAEALKSELNKYETHAAKVCDPKADPEKSFGQFVQNMEKIILAERTDWRQAVINRETAHGEN